MANGICKSAGGDGGAVRRLPRSRRTGLSRWPSVARSPSTSCVTSIPRSFARRARRRFAVFDRTYLAGGRARYPEGIPDKVRGLIEHELA